MSFRKLVLIGSLFVCAATPAFSADKWISIRSRNFSLVGNASEGQIRRVGRELEEFRSAIGQLLPGVSQDSSIATTVVVFKDDNSFRPYKPLYEGKPANIGGVYIGGSDVNFIALTASNRSTAIIYHEYVHSLTREAGSPLPPWASEGIAELYSTFEVTSNGKALNLGKPISDHIRTLRQYPLLPLQTFFLVDHDSPHYNERSKQGIFYAQSWVTVHYLMLGNRGQRRPQFSRFLALLSTGKTPDESFREAFGGIEYAALEKEIYDYVHQNYAYPGLTFDLQTKVDFDREMQTAILTEAQAQFYLGDFLLHLNRLDAAEVQLAKSIELDPKLAGGYASMGLLRLRQSRREDALKFLVQAVEAESQNHMAHYYYASLLERLDEGGGSSEREERLKLMRTHLRKAIELAPRYVESYSLLGYVAAMLREEMEETEQALRKAITFAPGRQDLQLSLIQVMMRNDKAQAARVLAVRVRDTAADREIRERAARLVDNINSQLRYESEMREYQRQQRAAEDAARTVYVEERTTTGPPALARRETEGNPATVSVPAGNDRPEPFVEGRLARIECNEGATFRLRIGNGTIAFHTDNPGAVEFKSYTAKVSETIPCGTLSPELAVRIYYRRGADPRYVGIPVLIEFIQQ